MSQCHVRNLKQLSIKKFLNIILTHPSFSISLSSNPMHPLCIMVSSLIFLRGFLSVQKSVSLRLYLLLMTSPGLFSFCLFVLFYSDILVFVMSYHIDH